MYILHIGRDCDMRKSSFLALISYSCSNCTLKVKMARSFWVLLSSAMRSRAQESSVANSVQFGNLPTYIQPYGEIEAYKTLWLFDCIHTFSLSKVMLHLFPKFLVTCVVGMILGAPNFFNHRESGYY